MRNLLAAAAGGLFGLGLMVSGMTDTTRVQGWLDVFGDWDPTLAFVMGGAILPMLIAWQVAERRQRSLIGTPIPARAEPRIGRNLVIGSVLFGAGWGLSGLCPGPAMAALSYNGAGGFVFIAAMAAGMLVAVPVKARLAAAA
ncbi:MAG TPA: hypothetical protein DDY29_05100 [Rhodobacteraceae bacterium]|nr:hypothetical protein [Paracoccaceae bacterium]HBG98114.1 hypothetical protein [Paracoccaceae bacterium]